MRSAWDYASDLLRYHYMARFQMSVRTSWTQEQAFSYMSNVRNFAQWDPGVASVAKVNGTPDGYDAQYDVKVTAGNSTLRYRVTDFAAPSRYVMTANNRWLKSVDEITVTANAVHGSNADTGCTVRYDATLTLNGRLRWFDFALKIVFDRIGNKAAHGLRAALATPFPQVA
jgi:carbon monoxide dehydrogenase subunit G